MATTPDSREAPKGPAAHLPHNVERNDHRNRQPAIRRTARGVERPETPGEIRTMKSHILAAVKAVVGGSPSMTDLASLTENGCPLAVVTGCGPLLAKLAKGEMLTNPEIADLKGKGGDPEKFLGLRPTTLSAALAPVPNPATTAEVLVSTGTDSVGNHTAQVVTIDDDAFAFILKGPEGEADEARKARRSLYNSFVSRTQTKVVEGYRAALGAAGVKVTTENVSEAMKAARTEIGLDKMLDGVLSKKGFRVSRDAQNESLIDAFRENLSILGIDITDAQHAAALAHGQSHAKTFAARASDGLKARGVAFVG